MLESISLISTQVLVLLILMLLGYTLGKSKMINDAAVKCINDICIYVVIPAVVIKSFIRPFEMSLLKNLLLAMLAGFISHFLCIGLGLLLVRNDNKRKEKVMRFAVIFSNCAFFAFPLHEAIIGSDGVFYGAGYLVAFNVLVWTYGEYMMNKGQAKLSFKKVILNPGIISIFIGLIIFFLSLNVPEVLKRSVSYISDLSTPLPMLIIGYTIAQADKKNLFHMGKELYISLLRLVVSPLLLLGLLFLFGYRGDLLLSVIICASTPVAAMTSMFAIKFDGDEVLAGKLVAISTILSIITITLISAFTSQIAYSFL